MMKVARLVLNSSTDTESNTSTTSQLTSCPAFGVGGCGCDSGEWEVVGRLVPARQRTARDALLPVQHAGGLEVR